MKHLSCLLLLSAALLATTPNLRADDKPDETTINLYATMLGYLDAEVVLDALKLDEPSRTRLLRLQKEWVILKEDEVVLSSLLNEDDARTLLAMRRRAAVQELLVVLSDGQAKRLKQIALQQAAAARSHYFPSPLALDPSLVNALNLSPEQQQQLKGDARKAVNEVLTERQKKQWSEITGAPCGLLEHVPRAHFPPSVAASAHHLTVWLFELTDPGVRKELGLSDAQNQALDDYARKPREAALKMVGLSPEEQVRFEAQTGNQLHNATRALLTPAQLKRFEQLQFQFRLARGITGEAPGVPASRFQPIYALDPLLSAIDFEFGPDQVERITKCHEERKAALMKLLLSSDNFDTVEKQIAKRNEQANKDLLAILTAKQKQLFAEQFGDPYRGRVPQFTSQFGDFSYALSPIRNLTGLYFAELLYLGEKEIQAELKLTPEQVKKVSADDDKWRADVLRAAATLNENKRTAALKALSASVEKRMGELLTPEQTTRLKQFAMQQRLEVGGPVGLCGYPGIEAGLNLTAEQMINAVDGVPLAKILTDEQRKKARDLRGARFEFVLNPTGQRSDPFHSFGRTRPMAQLTEELVEQELKLTEAQKEKVRAVEAERLRLLRRLEEKMPGSWTDEQEIPIRETVADRTRALLTPEQRTRLRAIELQELAWDRLGEALREKDVVAVLQLSKEQQEKLGRIEKEAVKRIALHEREQSVSIGPPALPFLVLPGVRNLENPREQLNEWRDQKLLAVLSDEQKEKWKTLLGKPFDFRALLRF